MRLAIVGSTRFAHPDARRYATALIDATIGRHQPDQIISGGATGVDTWAADVAARHGYGEANGRLVVYLPANRRWAPDGFRDRNLQIVADCSHLLAIRCAAARTYGSGWTADRAEQAGKMVARRIVPAAGPLTRPSAPLAAPAAPAGT